MVILEVNDIKWCFDLREIVFYDNKKDGIDYLDQSLREEENID